MVSVDTFQDSLTPFMLLLCFYHIFCLVSHKNCVLLLKIHTFIWHWEPLSPLVHISIHTTITFCDFAPCCLFNKHLVTSKRHSSSRITIIVGQAGMGSEMNKPRTFSLLPRQTNVECGVNGTQNGFVGSLKEHTKYNYQYI